MAPTAANRRKQTIAKKVVKKTKGGARRKRAPRKGANVRAPHKWSSKGAKEDLPKRADDSDISMTDSEDDEEDNGFRRRN